MRHPTAIPAKSPGRRRKVHWIAVNAGTVPERGSPISPESFGRTLCGAHYDATGWLHLTTDERRALDDPDVCRGCG